MSCRPVSARLAVATIAAALSGCAPPDVCGAMSPSMSSSTGALLWRPRHASGLDFVVDVGADFLHTDDLAGAAAFLADDGA